MPGCKNCQRTKGQQAGNRLTPRFTLQSLPSTLACHFKMDPHLPNGRLKRVINDFPLNGTLRHQVRAG
jgi:hypothetical protein